MDDALYLEHLPFCTKAVAFGKSAREMERYAKCMQRWSRFFAKLATKNQAIYQAARKEFLATQAVENEKVRKQRTPRDLTINTNKKSRLEKAIQEMQDLGMNRADAERMRKILL